MTQKLDAAHVEAIAELKQRYADTTKQIGNIAIDLHYAETQIAALKQMQQNIMQQFDSLREQENALIDKLKTHYGEGEIDVVAGTFTPAQ